MKRTTDSERARMFIEENKNRMHKEAIMAHLLKITKLKASTLNTLYNSTSSMYANKFQEEETKTLYKGRPRSFFKFDDSKLWRNLNE